MTNDFNLSIHRQQYAFLQAVKTHKITGLITGQGFGKTTVGVYQSLISAQEQVCTGMIVAPTHTMLAQSIMPIFNKVIAPFVVDGNKSEGWVTLANGSVIWLRSGDRPEKLDGSNLQWVWLDEAKIYPNDEIFRITIGRIGRDRRGGKMWITSTPLGISHWLYKLFVDNPPPDCTYLAGSTKDNIFAPPSYYESLKNTYTGIYADQQLEGKFVSFEGLVYDTFDLQGNVSAVQYDPDLPTYWAVDDGWASGSGEGTPSYHPRVILVCQQTKTGGFNVVYEYRATHELPEVSIINVLEQFPRMPNGNYRLPTGAYIDSSAQELKRRMMDVGILCANATHKITDGIKVVRRYVQDGHGARQLQIHPQCKGLIQEFQMYRWSERRDGTEPAPYKTDDHSLDAIRYLLYAFR